MLENTTNINMLYDFYHMLLTDKQREYLEMYYREDYSLGEIAENTKVSRQAVYDTIRRTEQLLHSYEEKLALYDKFKKRKKLLDDMDILLEKINIDSLSECVQKLKKID